MPLYTIGTPSGHELDIEAADEATALRGARQWHAENVKQSPIQIRAPDESIVEFPAGTSDETITKVMAQHYPPSGSTVADVAKALPTGVLEGAMGMAGAPFDLAQKAASIGVHVGDRVRRAIGLPAISPDVMASVDEPKPGTSAFTRKALEGFTGPLYEPKTTAGQYARTVGEFAPSLALGGPGSLVRRAATDVLLPALTSETAGQMAPEGLKDIARFAGGLAPNLALGAVRAHTSAPETAVQRATRGVTPDQWDAAEAVQNTGTRVGVPLSGPEAVQAATGNATRLGDVLRVVEGSEIGGTRTGQFFAERPEQMRAALARALDTIGPQDPNPSTLGPRAGPVADRAIAATPEGQALADAMWRAGPRITPEEAGQAIQPALARVYERREGMRAALGDRDYTAAKTADPTIPVETLEPGTFAPETRPLHVYEPQANGYMARPAATTPANAAPALAGAPGSATHVQTDPRDVLSAIDQALGSAKGDTATALQQARGMLFTNGALDTSVEGLHNARAQVSDEIGKAVRAGDNAKAGALRRVQDSLDETLSDVPAYAQAREGFSAASRPLDAFEHTPALARTIHRDQFNSRFALPPERVPGTLQEGGPSASRAFNQVAPAEAKTAYESHLTTTILDSASDARGRIDPNRLALALRDNEDLLRQHPAVAQRFRDVGGARAAMPSAGPLNAISEGVGSSAAGDVLLPKQGLVGGHDEVARTVRAMAAAEAGTDPGLTAALLRQRIGDQASHSMSDTVAGENHWGGAKFARDVAGTDQQRANLAAALGALPGSPEAPQAFADLLEAFRATGARKPQGSPTAVNSQVQKVLGQVPFLADLLRAPHTAGLSILTYADRRRRRA